MMCLLQTSRQRAVGRSIRQRNEALITDILPVLLHLISKMGCDEIILLCQTKVCNWRLSWASFIRYDAFFNNCITSKDRRNPFSSALIDTMLLVLHGLLCEQLQKSFLGCNSDWTWYCLVIYPHLDMGGITVTLCILPQWWMANVRLIISIMENTQLNRLQPTLQRSGVVSIHIWGVAVGVSCSPSGSRAPGCWQKDSPYRITNTEPLNMKHNPRTSSQGL